MGPNFFSWDGMGPNLCGMGAPGPTPSQDQDRDGTRRWWDGSSHPGPAASLAKHLSRLKTVKRRVSVNDNDCRSLRDSSRSQISDSEVC